jgi:amidase
MNLDQLILEKSITEIQEALMNKLFTCEDLVRYYMSRIEQHSDYHAVICINEKAIAIAKEQDLRIQAGADMGTLFGTVVLLKDNIATMDMPTTVGADALRDMTATRDAFVVEKLKQADAIIIGKANLSEWANFMSEPSSNGFSVVGGPTKNAYGDYDAGGSSSGSAVGVSLNLATVSIGSETCGSLIYPASMNGIVTLKPTVGLLSRDLVMPITEAQDTLGPMGRCVEDVWSVFQVALAYDQHDPKAGAVLDFDQSTFDEPLSEDYFKGKRIGLLKEASKRHEQLTSELMALGATIIELDIDQEKVGIDMMPVLRYGIKEDVKTFLNSSAINCNMTCLEDVVAFNKINPEKSMPYGQKHFEDALGEAITKEAYEKKVESNYKISSDIIDGNMKQYNLDVMVSFVTDLAYIYATARYPAVIVPGGYTQDEEDNNHADNGSDNQANNQNPSRDGAECHSQYGEPYGVTFVGTYLDDAKLLRYAYAYEKGTKHRKMPSTII